ncbi:type II secretion system protein [Priestia koreensis]|uniref:type II secretion system protein n=1 Tax=Priestia koreensis TaxID=284581 RepID=UPI00203DA05E|nr:type II secretion system GspH family protein [Priestia koreensis]
MFKKVLKNQKGLTLIELLAVVVILGIIAAIAIPSIGNIIQKSREDGVKADAMQIINAAKTYVSANGTPEGSGSGDTAIGAGVMTQDMLKKYVDDVSLKTGYKVTVTTDGTSGADIYAITGEGKAGKIDLKFADATIKQIKDDKDQTGTGRTIGTQPKTD